MNHVNCFQVVALPQVLCNQRRINLLIRPLLVNNARTEANCQAKLVTWWHLVSLLGQLGISQAGIVTPTSGPDISQQTSIVLLPFLKFCYGWQEERSVASSSRTPGLASTPQSPAKKHGSLARTCLEALVQVSMATVPPPSPHPPSCWPPGPWTRPYLGVSWLPCPPRPSLLYR